MKKNYGITAVTAAGILLLAHAGTATAEDTEELVATNIREMFTKGTPSGQIRLGYIMLDSDEEGAHTLDDLAIGGQLKYETASFYGVSLGAAFYTAHSITQGDDDEFNDELSSPGQHYDLLAEAYIDYGIDFFTMRYGRQQIDTPFANTDDCRMTPHTFEAITFGSELAGITFDAGYLVNWQGVDADYPNDADFGDLVPGSDGTLMIGADYANDLLEASAWYYGIIDVASLFYTEVSAPFALREDMELTLSAQATSQIDDTNEETLEEMGAEVDGELYGLMAEFNLAGITLAAAYTHAEVDEGSALFGGFGAGPFFTNMDSMVANEFAAGQDADAYTLSLGYDFSAAGVEGLSIGYAFGRFKGGADPMDSSADADVVEHDFSIGYELGDEWSMDAVYAICSDEEHDADTEWDFSRVQIRLSYSF